MARVWITRTQPGANRSADKIRSLGHVPVVAPLITIKPVSVPPRKPPREAVLIITSKNGLHALTAHTRERHWPIITVGDATAEVARKSGFEHVRSAHGTAKDVVALVRSDFAGDSRLFIHISGARIRRDISTELADLGFKTRRDIYYDTTAVEVFPAIDVANLTHILFYSPFAARALCRFDAGLRHLTAISISRETDNELRGLSFETRLTAASPTEEAMWSLLD